MAWELGDKGSVTITVGGTLDGQEANIEKWYGNITRAVRKARPFGWLMSQAIMGPIESVDIVVHIVVDAVVGIPAAAEVTGTFALLAKTGATYTFKGKFVSMSIGADSENAEKVVAICRVVESASSSTDTVVAS